jgi:chemotaxis protein MotA
MDKVGLGSLVTFWILILVAMGTGVGVAAYIDIPSVIIVLGGTMANIFASFELSVMKNMGKSIKAAFVTLDMEENSELVNKIIFYATEIKKNGVMSVEDKVLSEQNSFLKEGFSLLIDGAKPDSIEYLLETKIEHMENRHGQNAAIFSQMTSVAGAMGMIGTLVGLVAMLANLADPSAVGPAMAIALLTTLYGSLIGNGFAGPIANRLQARTNIEVIGMNIITSGVVMISKNESITEIKLKLNAILTDKKDEETK